MRVYQPIVIHIGAIVELDGPASHHLLHVMRASMHDEVALFNGQGGEYRSTIIKIEKKKIFLMVEEYLSREVESPIELYLIQGISRGERMDFTIQKAVELGVKKILPVFTERSVVKLDPKRSLQRVQHWQTIIIAACEQCGRNRAPEIFMPIAFIAGLSFLSADRWFILQPGLASQLRTIAFIDRPLSSQRIVLLVGPEGGFSEKEVAAAHAQGFHSLSMGPRILRTETAALAALAIFQSHLGDM